MKSKSKLIVLVFLLSISTFSFAGQTSDWGTIKQVYVRGDGSMVKIEFSQPIVNPDHCGAGGFYIRELDDSVGSSRFLSAILTAYTAKKKVSFWINGCTQGLWWGNTRPQLHDIYIQD